MGRASGVTYVHPLSRRVTSGVAGGSQWDATLAALAPTYWWKLNETSGTTAADSADANNATYPAAGVTYNVAGPTPDTAITLDGGTGHLIDTATTHAAPQTFTLTTWVKTTVTTAQSLILFTTHPDGSTGGSYDRQLFISGGAANFYVFNGAPVTLTGGTGISDGNWHWLAVTQGAAGQALYLDGASKATNANTAAAAYSAAWVLCGGAGATFVNAWLNGSTAQTAIWEGTALSSANIASLWAVRGT